MHFRTFVRNFWKLYKRNVAAVVGLGVFAAIVLLAILAPYIAPYPPLRTRTGPSYLPPELLHLMGTDDLGRDILSGVLQGARTSLMVGFLAVATSASIGLMIGILSGFYGGKIDLILSRVMELFMVIPRFMLGIVLVAIFGATIWNVVAVIGFLMWPEVARVVRSEYLTMKEWLFTEAARADGASNWTLMFSEILPNVVSAIVIITTLQIGNAILLEAGLSFIGAGDPNVPSWGMMLENAQAIFQRAWWTMVFPGLFLSATVLSFNLMGDGLNDALNPRLKISMS